MFLLNDPYCFMWYCIDMANKIITKRKESQHVVAVDDSLVFFIDVTKRERERAQGSLLRNVHYVGTPSGRVAAAVELHTHTTTDRKTLTSRVAFREAF